MLWHEEDGGTAWETSHRCCIMRKVIRKEVGAEDLTFLDSALKPANML